LGSLANLAKQILGPSISLNVQWTCGLTLLISCYLICYGNFIYLALHLSCVESQINRKHETIHLNKIQ